MGSFWKILQDGAVLYVNSMHAWPTRQNQWRVWSATPTWQLEIATTTSDSCFETASLTGGLAAAFSGVAQAFQKPTGCFFFFSEKGELQLPLAIWVQVATPSGDLRALYTHRNCMCTQILVLKKLWECTQIWAAVFVCLSSIYISGL